MNRCFHMKKNFRTIKKKSSIIFRNFKIRNSTRLRSTRLILTRLFSARLISTRLFSARLISTRLFFVRMRLTRLRSTFLSERNQKKFSIIIDKTLLKSFSKAINHSIKKSIEFVDFSVKRNQFINFIASYFLREVKKKSMNY